jgi:hypothetical protein
MPESLFAAVTDLMASEDGFVDGVRLCFAGRLDPQVHARLTEAPLNRIAELAGYLPHAESIRLLRRSAILLLLVDTAAQARSMLTGKIFEYLGAQVPILALGPRDGDAARLLARTGAGWIFEHGDVDALRELLRMLWRSHRAGDRSAPADHAATFGLQPNRAEIARYSRREQAKELAAIFDHLA